MVAHPLPRCRGPAAAAATAVYSRSSEPVRFERDCDAVLGPQGEAVTLPAGSMGYITQALGGSWTVFGSPVGSIGQHPHGSELHMRNGPHVGPSATDS